MILLTADPLDPAAVTNAVRQDGNGAVVTFLGTTRDNFGGKAVTRLEYEAYDAMAVKKLREVRDTLRADYGIADIAIAHRTGRVDVGHISLIVAVASPHRQAAFDACHEAVNRIKTIVPIWKKEWFADGSRWVACENHEFPDAAAARHHYAPTDANQPAVAAADD